MTRGRGAKELREYACRDCRRSKSHWGKLFWKKTPVQNPTAECRGCDAILEPIAVEDEVGYGVFECDRCDHIFTNGRAMWHVYQPCRGQPGSGNSCGNEVLPSSVGPWPRVQERKTRRRHECEKCGEDGCTITDPVSPSETAKDRTAKSEAKKRGRDKA